MVMLENEHAHRCNKKDIVGSTSLVDILVTSNSSHLPFTDDARTEIAVAEDIAEP